MTTEQQAEYLKARGWIQGAGDWWKHPRYPYTWYTSAGAAEREQGGCVHEALDARNLGD